KIFSTILKWGKRRSFDKIFSNILKWGRSRKCFARAAGLGRRPPLPS
ncbi:unnamed protein product, partial [Ectocarpus sp. 6 AP-2014]